MTKSRLIAVDWGTTSLRCYLISSTGDILEQCVSGEGILNVANGDFLATLERQVGNLKAAAGTLPILMSGMIGSRQGWVEAPYVSSPTGVAGLARSLIRLNSGSRIGPVWLVPGVSTQSAEGVPDVMRGEETQIFGAMLELKTDSGVFVLPGTHSKWVTVRDCHIVSFQTYMTGEIYLALLDHTILGRLVSVRDHDAEGFRAGVRASRRTDGRPGQLLHQLFSVRTLALFDQISTGATASYLSGLLIGSELCAAADTADIADTAFYVMATSTLSTLYIDAANVLGLRAAGVDDHNIVGGYLMIADKAGI
ncbi:MAG: 2-dehydro-3-deoxygalactonokinase [Hyphomicrobiaceae bacterium]